MVRGYVRLPGWDTVRGPGDLMVSVAGDESRKTYGNWEALR